MKVDAVKQGRNHGTWFCVFVLTIGFQTPLHAVVSIRSISKGRPEGSQRRHEEIIW